MAEIHPRTAPVFRRPVERLTAGVLVLLAALLLSLASAGAALAAKPRAASLTAAAPKVTGVTETSAKLRVSGTVKLPSNLANTARNRNKVRVAVTLQDTKRKKQSFTAKIDAKRKYAITKATTLRGALTVKVQARVSGKPSGKAVTKKVTVKPAGPTNGSPGGGSGATTTTAPVPADAERLVGLFRLDPGVRDPATGQHSGSYFRMGFRSTSDPNSSFAWILNHTSRSSDPSFTLLRPGSDGGLITGRHQEPSDPLYDDSGVLTQSIAQRELFFGQYFTVFTTARELRYNGDVAVPAGSPVPEIFYKDGRLYGQTTAFTANWSQTGIFAQGSPKADGSLPGDTKPVEGTYDPATRRYSLHWASQIVGGPFGGKTGLWYLSGTFEPTP